jgi:ribose-phosphate pyrophosphokinase
VEKRRPKPNQSKVLNLIGEVNGKNVLIRDDLVDTGGSMVQAAEYLRERGALEIYGACTHGVLSGNAIDRINRSPIKRMVITDSIDQSRRNLPEKFEVVSCAQLIGETIKRTADEESVSVLFDEPAKPL